MKRIIPMKGNIRGVLTVSERDGLTEIGISPQVGAIYLVDAAGDIFEYTSPTGRKFVGAFAVDNDSIIMSGGFAGRSSLEANARERLMMYLSPIHRADKNKTSAEKTADTVIQKNNTENRYQSAALIDILKKAAELFPPNQQKPAEEQGQVSQYKQDIANPFPSAYPLSRWRRVSYPGTDRYYLEGEMLYRHRQYTLYALPAQGISPGKGYNRFVRARDGSCWWIKVIESR